MECFIVKFNLEIPVPALWDCFCCPLDLYVMLWAWHTSISIPEVAPHTLTNLLGLFPAGLPFGLSGRIILPKLPTFFSSVLQNGFFIHHLGPVIGGLLILLLFVWFSWQLKKPLGEGSSRFLKAFENSFPGTDWLAKQLNGWHLGAGCKGGGSDSTYSSLGLLALAML